MAVASPINLGRNSRVRTADSKANKNILNISRLLFRKTKVKRDSIAESNILTKRRLENEDRAEREAESESQKNIKSPYGQQKTANNVGGSFLDRILGFIGYTALGWFLNNIPTWIGIGKEFLARLQKAGKIVSSIASDTIRIVTGFGNVLGAVGKNIISFDILDNSKRLETALNDLNAAFFDMHTQFKEGFDLVGTPLTEAKYSGEYIPEIGSEAFDQGAYPETPSPSGGPVSGIHRQALDIIAGPESGAAGYNAMNQGTDSSGRIVGSTVGGKTSKDIIGKNLTDMTIGEVMDRQNESKYPRNARPDRGIHAAGKYQIIGITLPGAMRSAGLKPTDRFSPENQDKLGLAVLRSQGIGAWTAGGSRYSARETAIIKQAQRTPLPTTPLSQVQNQSSLPSLPPTDTLSNGSQRYGAWRKGGRKHAGVDFDIRGPNAKFYSRIGGVVVGSPFRYGNDGWAIDIFNRQLGVYERIAEAARVLVKSGQTVNAGQAVVQGESGTGVIHYEIRKKIEGGFENTVDPISFLRGSSIEIAQSPAQVSAPDSQQRLTPQAITPERRGQDIIITSPNTTQSTPTPQPSRSGGIPMVPDESSMLNNFIKNKLLLDLAYL